MRILVCGGRAFADYGWLTHVLDAYLAEASLSVAKLELIGGGARGADSLAHRWATERQIPFHEFKARWDDTKHPQADVRFNRKDGKPYNAAAGFIRNQRMVDEGRPDIVIAFPGGGGTRDMMLRATEAGVPVRDMRLEDGSKNPTPACPPAACS